MPHHNIQKVHIWCKTPKHTYTSSMVGVTALSRFVRATMAPHPKRGQAAESEEDAGDMKASV
eukprot:scaffold11052_cov48-Tisochrysis_lutea.AAC.2